MSEFGGKRCNTYHELSFEISKICLTEEPLQRPVKGLCVVRNAGLDCRGEQLLDLRADNPRRPGET
jgi:hypothetical protein